MEQPVGLEIKASPISGKGIFATKSFAPGDVVLELERPLVATLDKERVEDTCGWCFNWINLSLTAPTAIPAHRKVKWCSGCNKIKYCSKVRASILTRQPYLLTRQVVVMPGFVMEDNPQI